MKIPFTKCHANGNDFILLMLDDLNNKILKKNMIKKLCDRHRGIGSDGLLLFPN